MRFSILGPTQVWRADGREVTVGGPRLRALLALLLVDAHRFARLAAEGRRALAASAQVDYARAVELARRAGVPLQLAVAHCGLGGVARLLGDLAQARRLCEAALAECPTGWFSGDVARAEILVALGRDAEAEGDAGAAQAWHRQALTAALGHGGFAAAAAAAAAEGLAGVALLEGDGERAALLLGVGAAVRGAPVASDPDVARLQVAARARIGEAAYQQARQRGAAMPRDQALSLLGAPPSASGA